PGDPVERQLAGDDLAGVAVADLVGERADLGHGGERPARWGHARRGDERRQRRRGEGGAYAHEQPAAPAHYFLALASWQNFVARVHGLSHAPFTPISSAPPIRFALRWNVPAERVRSHEETPRSPGSRA